MPGVEKPPLHECAMLALLLQKLSKSSKSKDHAKALERWSNSRKKERFFSYYEMPKLLKNLPKGVKKVI